MSGTTLNNPLYDFDKKGRCLVTKNFPGIASFNGVQMEIAVKPANLLKLGRHLGPGLVSVTTLEYLESLIELNSVCVR